MKLEDLANVRPESKCIYTIVCGTKTVFFALKGQGILAQGKATVSIDTEPPPWVSRHPKPLTAL